MPSSSTQTFILKKLQFILRVLRGSHPISTSFEPMNTPSSKNKSKVSEKGPISRILLCFYKSKERKSIKLSLKCMRSKTISHLSFGMTFFFCGRQTAVTGIHLVLRRTVRKLTNVFLKHLHTAIVLLHFVGQISRNSCIPLKWIYKATEPNTIYIFNRHHHLVHQR